MSASPAPRSHGSTDPGKAEATSGGAQDAWWSLTEAEVARRLGVDPAVGLLADEVEARRRSHGLNQLSRTPSRGALRILAAQFKSVVMALLTVAGFVSLLFGDWVEAVAIGCVLLINALLGFIAELKAARSMEALRALTRVSARVRRERKLTVVPAAMLVPGDVLILEAGDVISADLRILSASQLQASEAALTGESLPVSKTASPVASSTSLAERTSMLFSGTSVSRGAGEAVVVATGMNSQLGRIAQLVDHAREESTPLERRLEDLAKRLIWLTLAVASVPVTLGLLRGRSFPLMAETGIALAVAAIPEGLPIVATLALARGMWRMARRQALVNRLAAVETLGAINTVITDKTGTLTENRLAVARVVQSRGGGSDFDETDALSMTPPQPALDAALRAAVLCNNAGLDSASGTGVGDPLEVSLLEWAAHMGCDPATTRGAFPELREEAFDATTRRMATFHQGPDGILIAVKGAAEALIPTCETVRVGADTVALTNDARDRWLARADRLAGQGLRVLALADRRVSSADAPAYQELRLLALIGFLDPPRKDVRVALEACRDAGIQVVMATGDHAATALTVAAQVGLVEPEAADDANVLGGESLVPAARVDAATEANTLRCRVFARIEPEQKLRLVELHQRHGGVVAMTGDGVNDAPALKKADVGVAMGRRGTQVACEAAAVVLKDDSFGTIVTAIRQGRVIFENIRKFVCYLLSCNLSEVFVVTLASILPLPLPLLPLQVLFLNLVTDVFPALALAFGEGGPEVMRKPPRPAKEPIITRRHWWAISAHAGIITGCVLAALLTAQQILGLDDPSGVTVSFLTLAIAQLGHVVNMRGPGTSPWRNSVTRNPWIWGAIGLCVVILLAAVWTPPLARLLDLQPIGSSGWAVVLLFGTLPAILGLARGKDSRLAP